MAANQNSVWNTVFGAQGLNGYPLEVRSQPQPLFTPLLETRTQINPQLQPWNKVTGEIYPEAVEYWKPFDLSHYITSNWANAKNLGQVLRGRIFVYVGSHDNYYLNEGVERFQQNVDSFGGAGWVSLYAATSSETLLRNRPN